MRFSHLISIEGGKEHTLLDVLKDWILFGETLKVDSLGYIAITGKDSQENVITQSNSFLGLNDADSAIYSGLFEISTRYDHK